MTNAVKRAALYLTIAGLGFLLLGFIAIYCPENFLLRHTDSSTVKNWLPGKDDIPPGMVLIDRYTTTNEQVAESYPNRDEVLHLVESWGREESYTHVYLSRDRCTTVGPRLIRFSIILHKDEAGAQQYLEWLRERDLARATKYEKLDIGDGGYQFWMDDESSCYDKSVKTIEVVFCRNNAQGVVAISGTTGQDDQLLEAAMRLAKILDENIQKNTASR